MPKKKGAKRKLVKSRPKKTVKKPVFKHGIASRVSSISKRPVLVKSPPPREVEARTIRTFPVEKPRRIENRPQRIEPERISQSQPSPQFVSSSRPIASLPRMKGGSHKIPSGIPGFDNMAGDGFERNSINLIVGSSGAGKSIFALQFLLEGLKRGEKVLYVTFEEQKSEFYDSIKHLGWDLEKAEQTGKFIFLEYSPEKVKMMLDEGGGAIESAVFKNNISRLVVDSLTSFALLFDDERSRRQAVLEFFDIIRKWNCTTILTVQHDPSDDEHRGMSSFEFEADSITLLYFLRAKGERQRFMEILKMRGTKHSKETHVFKIEGGIVIGPRV